MSTLRIRVLHAVRCVWSHLRRALEVFQQYIEKRMKFPFFSNARTVSLEHAEQWWARPLGSIVMAIFGDQPSNAWCTVART